jgi:hypothetical protein
MLAAARAFDEDAAHGFGSHVEKVGAIVERAVVTALEAQPGLVHQCGGLQRVAGRFAGHLERREFAELLVDRDQQLACGRDLSLAGGRQRMGVSHHGRHRTILECL